MENYEALAALLRQTDLFQEQADTLLSLQQQFRRDELVVSVVGQFKRGKSSLINTILGQPLLPVAIRPLTSVVTEIRWNSGTRAQVEFRDGAVRSISPEELELYCSEKGNPSNRKGVEAVRLWTPRQPFGPGTVLVDTPGVGSTNRENTRETLEYLIHSDAVIFVLSVDSPINETEQQLLREIRQYASRLWLVVNKADMAGEEDRIDFLDYCRGVLEEELQSTVALRMVSARTGEGVEELTEQLGEELKASRSRLREDSARQKLSLVLRRLQALLSAAEQTASAPPEELQAKRLRLAGKQQELLSCGDTLQVLAAHHTEKLVAGIGEDLRSRMGELRQGLERRGEELAQELEGLPLARFKSSYQEQLEQDLRARLEELNESGTARLKTGFGEVTALLTARADETEQLLAGVLREEFQVEYPLTREEFAVSDQEDFYLRVDLQRMPRLYLELKDRLTSRRSAQARFLEQCRRYAEDCLECNVNNMIYNYRYKMQESLRPLCRRLEDRVRRVGEELGRLIALLDVRLRSAEQEQKEKEALFAEIRQEVERLLS